MSRTIHERFVSVEEAQNYALEKSRDDFGMFLYTISLGSFRLYKIHREWFDAINDPQYQYINISTFPGSGKTTLIQYWIAWRIGQEPYLTWMVVGSSFEKAVERVSAIKKIIELPMYKKIFPHISIDQREPQTQSKFSVKSTKWRYNSESELPYSTWRTLIAQMGELKEPTIVGYGVMSDGILGARITGAIVMDDIHNQKNVMTEEQRFKVFNVVQNNIKSRLTESKLSKNPKLINICNRFHPTDTAGRLAELVREDGTPVWKNISTPIYDEDENPTCPEIFGKEKIEKLREEYGGRDSASWKMLYLINPSGSSNSAFTLDRLRRGLPEILPEFADLIITVDFAHTQSRTADYTVFTAIARDKAKPFNLYVLDIMRFKLSQISDKISQLIAFYKRINEIYGDNCLVRYIVFENKDSEAERQFLQSQAPEIPVNTVNIRKDKASRLGEFEAYVQSGKVYFNTSMQYYNAMVGELMDFPSGKHDDICDTLSMPFQIDGWTNIFGQSGIVYIQEKRQEEKRRTGVI